jgi:hypothetical protein
MRSLYFWLIVFSSWLFILFNVERLSPALDLAGFVYLLAIVCVIETILLLSWSDLPLVVPLRVGLDQKQVPFFRTGVPFIVA